MWIRSQDKKQIANVISVDATKVMTGKQKGAIFAYTQAETSYGGSRIQCGSYETFEKALDELDRFEKALLENPNGFYQFN